MWPDSKLAARIEGEYVPIKLMDETAMDIAKAYDVQVVPTFVIAKTDGELLLKQVGPPFSKPTEAVIWFDAIAPRLKTADEAEAAAKARPGEFAAQLALFRACNDLGRTARAEEAMLAAEKLAGDSEDNKLEIDVARLTVLASKQKMGEAAPVADRVAAALLKKKDKRLVELGLLICDVYSFIDRKDEPRTFIKQVNELFPDNPNRIQYNVRAAFALMQGGDKQGALKEFEAIIAAGPADDIWVNYATEARDHVKKSLESPGGG
ncbi:MAG: hypothetical protein IT462_09580 [Planctomycetes bacterium]|nr:hypothetical protein [Planctomycetota bacterium]